ncbi:MAG: nitroreductase [Pseudomonadota bacterium]
MSNEAPEAAQHFESLVMTRHSMRGFLDKRVPEPILHKVFDLARWAPSGTNVQPWHVCVASGEVLDGIRTGFLERFDNGVPIKTDHAPDGRTPAPWQDRKRACARALYGSMGIEWEDRAGRARAARRNYEFFDAPHAVFLGMHEVFGTQTASDVGMFAQTLMLAMHAYGIDSCPQGTLRNYPDFVREVFGLEGGVKILFGISFGYADPEVPANATRTERASLEETVQFLG